MSPRRFFGRLFGRAGVILLFLFPFIASSALYCQDRGFTYSRFYDPKDYKGSPINRSILQDKRGIIYAGNNEGVLEFDGVSWRTIPVPNNQVFSLAMDETGTIYAGGNDEIGFLAPDALGALHYVSLLDRLESHYKNFSTVWKIHATREGVYFYTSKFLFRWERGSGKFRVWEPRGDRFNASFYCSGTFFIHQENVGLMEMVDNSPRFIPGIEKFAAAKLYMMVPYDPGKLLIGTRTKGFYLHDDAAGTATPFPTEADAYLLENELYYGRRLSDGTFAMATRRGGLVVMDSQGRLQGIYNNANGLPDDNVKYVFEDIRGNLWLALSKGILKIEYITAISIYDGRSQLPGNVLTVVKHQDRLYAGTDQGLFVLSAPLRFQPAAGISDNCWSLFSRDDTLLAATTGGVIRVKNNSKRTLVDNPSYFLLPSKKANNRIWVGTRDGLVSLANRTGDWIKEGQVAGITHEIQTIAEDREGNVWLGTLTQGVIRVMFPSEGTPGSLANPAITRFQTGHGLPSGRIEVFMATDHIMLATTKGIFRCDEVKGVILPDNTLGKLFAGGENGRSVFRLSEDINKNLWLHSFSRNLQMLPQADGTFEYNVVPFLRLPNTQVNTIYPDPGGEIVWFAANEGLIRYDTRVEKNYRQEFQTLVRSVIINGKPVFRGYNPGAFFPIVPPTAGSLHFEFAAPFFEAEESMEYRCVLEGYEKEWSPWSTETRKDYFNLEAGRYTFRVQAQNVYDHESKEAVFKFKVLQVWYRTWWAAALYALTGIMVLVLAVKWRSGKLQKEKQKLEEIVKERTEEINEKNRQLETQTLQLKEQAAELRELGAARTSFFTNISHEFRTPLTLIMGPLEQMLAETRGKDPVLEKKIKLMLRNAQRLFTLINRLLDLSRLDSGKMRLRAAPQNIVPFIKGIAATFDLLATQYDLELTVNAPEDEIILYFDREKMEDVLCNLLINAIKFTPAGGKITVTVKPEPEKNEEFPAGSLEIVVSDTGPGIPREQLAHIFDRFYQADSTFEQHRRGTGIGLALTRELIHLHHGGIDVHSREGENRGTDFIIHLPLGREHLETQDIVPEGEILPEQRKPFTVPAAVMVEREPDFPRDEEKASDTTAETSFKTAPESASEIILDTEPTEKDGVGEKNIILVVEDSADVREYIKGALEPAYTVLEAKDGREGIREALEQIPDLIISDVMMPVVDGYHLCQRLKQDVRTSHIPIILLTAKASEENIIQGLETGANDYITKPFSTRILVARIKNLLELRRQFQLTLYREMTGQPVKIPVSKVDREFLKELQDIMEKKLSDSEFNVERLGKKLYMSRATLYRKIHALSGEAPNEFLQSYRLKRAAELLENNFGTVLEVAFEVGFSSASYFTKCFKKKFNRLPSEFPVPEPVSGES